MSPRPAKPAVVAVAPEADTTTAPPASPPPWPGLRLKEGQKVRLWYRGIPQEFPAWVTRLNKAPGNEALTLTMLWDRGSGVGIVLDPVHVSERRHGAKESFWDFEA